MEQNEQHNLEISWRVSVAWWQQHALESGTQMHDIAVDMALDFINLKRGLAEWQYTRTGTPSGLMENSDYQS